MGSRSARHRDVDGGRSQERPRRNARVAQTGGAALAVIVIGSLDNALPEPVTRFLVEVPSRTIEAFVRFGFIRSNQQDDLAAIMGALRRLGQAPDISRIT